MIIKTREEIPAGEKVELHGVIKELAVGEYDGSDQIVLRILSLDVDRFIPLHAHDFPHIWKIERGVGMLSDNEGVERQVTAGEFIFIPNNEKHGMQNVGNERLEYLCFGTIESEKTASKNINDVCRLSSKPQK